MLLNKQVACEASWGPLGFVEVIEQPWLVARLVNGSAFLWRTVKSAPWPFSVRCILRRSFTAFFVAEALLGEILGQHPSDNRLGCAEV
jgi:hypothetical protein